MPSCLLRLRQARSAGVGLAQNNYGIVATRLNLDVDLRFTATERIHAFFRPLDQNGTFTSATFGTGNNQGQFPLNGNVQALFFEGDAGAIGAGLTGRDSKLDLPFTFGLIPLLFQNGVWLQDAFTGAAFTIPARNSRLFDFSNFDVTFFAGFDDIDSPAFVTGTNKTPDNSDGRVVGVDFFVDALQGYWEGGYAYLIGDDALQGASYNNFTLAYTRRYFNRLSNSIRVIANAGQEGLPGIGCTANGVVFLMENSLVTSKPYTLVPYCNLFAGIDHPQSVARDAGAGGVLNNTGILFEPDALTSYPTLDATANNTYGGALGLEYLNKFNNTCYLQNRVGALYEIQSDGTNITASSSDNLDDAFYNYGALRKTGGDGVSRINAAFCNCGGTVEVQRGTLILAGGGVSSNGVFNVAAGASLDLTGGEGPRYFGTFTGTGGGRIGWSSGSFGRWSSVVLEFTNGVYWGGGQFNGYIRNNGLMLVEGSAQKENFISTLDNYGTIRQSGSGSLYLNEFVNQCSLNNQTGALYDLQANGNNITGGGGSTYFRNYGILRKSAGAGTSIIQSPFYNYAGTVEALAGTLQFSAYTHSNAVIQLNGGNASFPAFTLSGGTLQGTGTVTVAGTLTSSGTVAPGLSAGILQFNGNYTQTASGALDIEIAGHNPGEFDQLVVSGNASLSGALNVTLLPPFLPVIGERFQILSCANRTGNFSLTNVPTGLAVGYTNNGVFLVVTGPVATTLLNPGISGTNFTFSFQTQSNQNYRVEYNDDLSTTNWEYYYTMPGDGSLMPCLIPMTNSTQRFFRVRQP